MPLTINTGNYLQDKHILVDGKDWTVKLPGAGTELKLSQSKRRIKLLDKKIENGTATEEDYDLYDELEDMTLKTFESMFNDGTEDNKSVVDWVRNTPLIVIMAAFEEIKKQAENKGNEAKN